MMMRVMACCLSPRIKLLTYRELEGNNQPVDGYSPSPGGLLEIGRNQYLDPLWLREHYPDNSLVKIFHEGLPYLPSASGFFKEPNYTIIFMRRSEEEINASVERTEKYLKDLEAAVKQKNPDQEPRVLFERYGGFDGFDLYKEYNAQDIAHAIGICDARKDIKIIEVQFEDFIKDTRAELLKIIGQLPTLVTKEKFEFAVDQVKPEFHRIKCA
jgi:hypothetical protein